MSAAAIAVPAGAVLTLYGCAAYALRTLRGTADPNPLTWLLWALAPGVAFVAQLAHHGGLAALTTLSVGLGPLLVFGCGLTRPGFRRRPSRFEVCCGTLSLAALTAWWATADPDTAIVLSILADGLAAVPTLVKSYRDPGSEDRTVYALAALSAALTLVTLPVWSLATAGFACYLLVLESTLVATLSLRSRPARLDVLVD